MLATGESNVQPTSKDLYTSALCGHRVHYRGNERKIAHRNGERERERESEKERRNSMHDVMLIIAWGIKRKIFLTRKILTVMSF